MNYKPKNIQKARVFSPTTPFPDVPATPYYPDKQNFRVEPGIHTHVTRYTRWLHINNSIAVSPQTIQAYQDAALESKKIGTRDICTFAPFQERDSALQVITTHQILFLMILVLGWIVGLFLLHIAIFTITFGLITLLYSSGFIASSLLATSSFKGHSGEKIAEEIIIALDQLGIEWSTYTVLCPLYKEAAVVPQLVEAMKSLDYPIDKLQVLFLTEEHDNETRTALYKMHIPPHFTILTVPNGSPQTKPRACNFGLLQATGQFIVIFDAEDKPEPYQLKKAILTFANHGSEVACVQAKLNYYNSTQNLLTRWLTAEYSTWFDIMLLGLQRTGFSLPLGGTSNHFRTEVLRMLGGWDAFNVTEDCDLGLRISQYNLKTVILDSSTSEEATSQLKTWLFQRSRWIKGYLQTYLVHMRHPLQTLQRGHVRKFFSVQLIVGAWTAVLFINPFMWALTLFYMLFRPVQLYNLLFPGPILYMGAVCLILGNFFYIYIHVLGCLRRREYALIKWVLLSPLYWIMMSVSAYIALYQLIIKPHYWEKTQHGNHLSMATNAHIRPVPSTLVAEERSVGISMSTTIPFAITEGSIVQQTTLTNEPNSTTQRLTALRNVLSGQLGNTRTRRQLPVPHIRDRWLLSAIGIAIIMSILSTCYFFQHHLTLVDSDANSHMEIARRIFDNVTPGLAQLGGVWLPLPHILIALFAWNDFLWATGLAGSLVSMACYSGTTVFIFLSARRLTHNSCASFIGTLLFLLNPNILYLQATPMTEPLCWLTLTASCYYLLAWAQEDSNTYLILTAASTLLATLTRYDGWFMFALILVAIPLTGLLKHHPLRKIEGNLSVFILLGGLGILLWLAWDQIIFGNALYFLNGPYSAQQQAIARTTPSEIALHHNLLLAIRLYTINCAESLGLGLSLIACAAILLYLLRHWKSVEVLAVLAFLAPFAFYIIAIVGNQVPVGSFTTFHPLGIIPGSDRNSLFNARFGSEMVAPLAVFCATLVPTWSRTATFRRFSLGLLGRILLLLCIVLQSGWIAYGGIVTILGSTNPSFCIESYPLDVYLAQHYNGGYILQSDYPFRISEAQAGIHFNNVIYEGSGPRWTQALQHPETNVSWVVFQPGDSVAQAMERPRSAFLQNFSLIVTSPYGLRLYHRNGLSPLPTRPITSYLLSEQQSCTLSFSKRK